jgi:hypothetical protein
LSLKANIPTEDMINKTNAEIGYFKYMSIMIRKNATCTWEIKYNIAIAKAAFRNKKHYSTANCT